MLRVILAFVVILGLAPVSLAQEAGAPPVEIDRSATGGAQTLEDILARQRGERVDTEFRRQFGDPDSAAGIAGQLGTLGGASDPDLWRALRYGEADVTVSSGGDVAKVLVQDGGMAWYQFRQGPLLTYGGYLLLGMIGLLALFFLARGRIRVDAPATGRLVVRFNAVERFAHWLLAGSFILLGVTGLVVLMGRKFIAPYMGKDFNSLLLTWSKVIHNNVAWAFMLALVMVFVFWVVHNFPSRHDLKWIAQFGGIVGKKHPPAKKFNAGQKVIFWSVIILGASISASGLSLLFPFEMPMFAKTFAIMNQWGMNEWVGMAPFPERLSPQEEMQFAQAWHAIVAFVLMAIIIAHIYIGTLGMEGAIDAMGSGEVDEAWAHQHHSLWLEEVKAKEAATGKTAPSDATPAE
ncbi:Formate dehydrogenase -O, gamma subunit [Candidatus Rhodobacter oscarellae]|uniref:Formate dehydrogenase-O, gamma subunit n=1 Tax=Candidatus Rhodobacter oscarellae TaxID=1675527 RepID=A0A0J9E1C6_9RHOB|nr:formate dehydrogenase subunit gamma [Candidatus Rhodobacter lobularis]KMW56540.1 Formate dehydrogenase -O, gamma subunit [Candidatus Rhodobacter lobularis]